MQKRKRPPYGKTLSKMSFRNSRAFRKACPERLESICMNCFGYFGHLLTRFDDHSPFFFHKPAFTKKAFFFVKKKLLEWVF